MRSLLVAIPLIVAVLGGATPAQAGAKPKVLTQKLQRPFEVRPGSIGYTGDGTGVLGGADGSGPSHPGHLKWTRYTRRNGNARGVDWLNDCEPDCADGHYSAVPVRVHVFRPRHERFTRMTLKYRYHGRRVLDRRILRRNRVEGHKDYWVWALR